MEIKCYKPRVINILIGKRLLRPYIWTNVSGNLRLAELAQVLQAGKYRGFSVGRLYRETSQLLDAPLLFFHTWTKLCTIVQNIEAKG
jgi:hypothetical protein